MIKWLKNLFNNCKQNIIRFFKWLFSVKTLINHKLAVCIFLVITYLFIIWIIPHFVFPNEATLENYYYISQIISSLIVLLSATLALVQYIDSSNEKREDRLNQQKLKAAELAKSFADEAIPKARDITNIFRLDKTVYTQITNKLNAAELVDFNETEVKKLFPDYKDLKLKLAVANYMNNHSGREQSEISHEDVSGSLKEIDVKCHELANLFEYYAICFNAGIVDNDTLYQSLHKVFIEVVHLLYIFIFCYNRSEADRLFYNTSKLYMDWKKIYKEKMKKEVEINKEIDDMVRDKRKELIIKP